MTLDRSGIKAYIDAAAGFIPILNKCFKIHIIL